MTSTTPSRENFADITATAYVQQFVDDHRVMNQMVITWNGEEFLKGSSLSVTDGEVVVLELEDGIFGSEGLDTAEVAHESIYGYLTDEGNNGSDDLWRDVLNIIAHCDFDE